MPTDSPVLVLLPEITGGTTIEKGPCFTMNKFKPDYKTSPSYHDLNLESRTNVLEEVKTIASRWPRGERLMAIAEVGTNDAGEQDPSE